MRWILMPILTLAALLLFSAFVRADSDPHSPQIGAAAADAMEALRREVLDAFVTPDLTVKGLIDRVGGAEQLQKTLSGAEQIGGTRWLDDQTCQVRLEISGADVARTLLDRVHANPKNLPAPAPSIERGLDDWKGRTFSATGTSTGGEDIQRLRPSPSNRAWAGVTDAERRRALVAARDLAIQRVLNSLAPIPLEGGRTFDQAIAVPEVSDALRGWLAKRPVKTVEFDNDLSVRLVLSAPPEELWHVLKAALVRQTKLPMPKADAGWDRLQEQVISRTAPAVGVALARVIPATGEAPPNLIPRQAPPWVGQQAEAEGWSKSDGPKLRTARAAEAVAIERLRSQVNALPLSGDLTLGDAARRDRRIDDAIRRAVARARPFKVEYRAHGAAEVHVSMQLSDLWAELNPQ